MRRLALTVIAISVTALITAGTGNVNAEKEESQTDTGYPPIPIETAKVSRKVFSKKLSLFGSVHAGRSASVRSEVEGVVASFTKEVGDKVIKGETVCRIDDGKYRIAVQAAAGNLERSKAALDKAKLDLERATSLFEKKIASREALDKKKILHRMAKAETASRNAEVKDAKRDLELTKIKAPYSGYLAAKKLQKGDWVKAGNEVFDIVDLSSVYLLVSLPEKELGKVSIGSPAKLWLDAYPKEKFDGKITRISPRTSSKTRAFEMRIDFKDKKKLVRDGLFARVEIVPAERLSTMIPKDAVVERGPNSMVFRINGNIAQQVDILVTGQSGKMVEVQGELKEGDELAVTGNEILQSGEKVNVTLRR